MFDHDMTIDRNAIQSMTTARIDRIYLPFGGSDIYYHAGALLADHIGQTRDYPDTAEGDRQLSADVTALLDHSTVNGYLVLQPSRAQPRAGLAIDVTTPDGQRLHRSIYAPSGGKAAAEIITEYLMMGAPGLRDDVHQTYRHQHRTFTERQQGKRKAA